jgi:hypothetical protein
MPGYGKLHEKDAHNLSLLLSEFRPSVHMSYIEMLLYCFSNSRNNGKPCPYFNVGLRQMASHCNTSVSKAQRMIDKLEERGLIVNLGTETVRKTERKGRPGEYTKRTFWWIAEEYGCIGNHRETDTPIDKNAGETDTHQRATPSRGRVGVSTDATTPTLVDRDIEKYPDLIE